GWGGGVSAGEPWRTTDSLLTGGNAAIVTPEAANGFKDLTSPAIRPLTSSAQLYFSYIYQLEEGGDGGVLEIAINGGAFQDIPDAGGSFLEGGYNGTIDANSTNPLAGRMVWTGSNFGSAMYEVGVQLPPNLALSTIRLRWRMGSNDTD